MFLLNLLHNSKLENQIYFANDLITRINVYWFRFIANLNSLEYHQATSPNTFFSPPILYSFLNCFSKNKLIYCRRGKKKHFWFSQY